MSNKNKGIAIFLSIDLEKILTGPVHHVKVIKTPILWKEQRPTYLLPSGMLGEAQSMVLSPF